MEGTRNERSVLITVSYIIGFVTAFILFMNNSSEVTTLSESLPSVTQTSNVINSQSVSTDITQSTDPSSYLKKPHALLSPDNKNIFFCETGDDLSDQCRAYVYSLDTDTAQRVYLDGQELVISKNVIRDVKWTDVGLSIDNISSINPAQPWHLITTNTPIDLQS